MTKRLRLIDVRSLLVEAIQRDQPTPDALLWLDRLRSRGWPSGNVAPFTHGDLLAFLRDGVNGIPDLTSAQWDAFLALCDDMEARQ
jgi:hypothetical protein